MTAQLHLTWRERGGPALAHEPDFQGFGGRLTDRIVADAFGGQISRHWARDGLDHSIVVANAQPSEVTVAVRCLPEPGATSRLIWHSLSAMAGWLACIVRSSSSSASSVTSWRLITWPTTRQLPFVFSPKIAANRMSAWSRQCPLQRPGCANRTGGFLEAVKLVRERGVTVAQAARLLAQRRRRLLRQAHGRRLKRGVFCSIVDLQAAINRFVEETNHDPKPFVWTADPNRVLAAVTRGKQALESLH